MVRGSFFLDSKGSWWQNAHMHPFPNNFMDQMTQKQPRALIMSSHNRSPYLHSHWVLGRGLPKKGGKKILYLPFSEGGSGGRRGGKQRYSFETFSWFYSRFEPLGIKFRPFYFNYRWNGKKLARFFNASLGAQILVLGGGSPWLGMSRMRSLGKSFRGDPHLMEKIIHWRALKGRMTVGFSAGGYQLGSYCSDSPNPYNRGFNLISNCHTLHHYASEMGSELYRSAHEMPHCQVFGLPNDSGIACWEENLDGGGKIQILEFIVDQSWDLPQDRFHVKTRMGMGIETFFPGGGHWIFRGGEKMISFFNQQGRRTQRWLNSPGRGTFNFESGQPLRTGSNSI